jgi:hypothetical protein
VWQATKAGIVSRLLLQLNYGGLDVKVKEFPPIIVNPATPSKFSE